MKQITIYDLLPLLKKGWVAMDKDNNWCFFNYLPNRHNNHFGNILNRVELYKVFNIAPFDGDWEDSLIKVEHKEEE